MSWGMLILSFIMIYDSATAVDTMRVIAETLSFGFMGIFIGLGNIEYRLNDITDKIGSGK